MRAIATERGVNRSLKGADFQLCDPIAFAFDHLKTEAVEREHLTHSWDHLRLVNDQPAMVFASSSGRFQSLARFRSRIVVAPSTMNSPSPVAVTDALSLHQIRP